MHCWWRSCVFASHFNYPAYVVSILMASNRTLRSLFVWEAECRWRPPYSNIVGGQSLGRGDCAHRTSHQISKKLRCAAHRTAPKKSPFSRASVPGPAGVQVGFKKRIIFLCIPGMSVDSKWQGDAVSNRFLYQVNRQHIQISKLFIGIHQIIALLPRK